jgi:hypothetical protein
MKGAADFAIKGGTMSFIITIMEQDAQENIKMIYSQTFGYLYVEDVVRKINTPTGEIKEKGETEK